MRGVPSGEILSLRLTHFLKPVVQTAGARCFAPRRQTTSVLALVLLVAALYPMGEVPSAHAAEGDRRVAVLFGNSDYGSPQLNLNSPPHDVQLLSDTLKSHTDFEVLSYQNLSRPQMIRALLDARDLAGGGTVVFYYSGHAIQVDGENYLLPKGVQVKSMRDVPVEAVSVRQVLQVFHDVNMKVVILDSCRTNPFGLGGKAIGAPGLSRENLSGFRGTLISYAAAPGTVAYDGEQGQPSPFTTALVENLTRPDLDIVDLFIQTRGDLERLTQDRERGPQRSEEINSLTADHELVFVRSVSGDVVEGVKTRGDAPISSEKQATKSGGKKASMEPAKAIIPLEERRHIMVPGLRQNNSLTKEVADALNNVILAEFQNDPRYVVVGGGDIAALLEQETQKQLMGCDEDSCLAEVGEALGADILAKTSLAAVGNSYLLSVNLIDVETATPMRRISARSGRDDDVLIEAAQKAVQAVLDDSADNGVIVVGDGITRQGVDDDSGLSLGPPPAWPFAAAAGTGALVAAGAAIVGLSFAGAAYSTLNVSVADPAYETKRGEAQEMVGFANVSMGIAGTAAALSVATAAAAAGLFFLSADGSSDDGEDAGSAAAVVESPSAPAKDPPSDVPSSEAASR